MGYTIKIGNAKPQPLNPEYEQLNTRYSVELVSLPEAPAFGEPTDYENQRWPSYIAWAETAEEACLKELLIETWCKPHPGCVRLQAEHLELIRGALKRPLSEWVHNRLIWCEFWVDWALKNCELPAVENS